MSIDKNGMDVATIYVVYGCAAFEMGGLGNKLD